MAKPIPQWRHTQPRGLCAVPVRELALVYTDPADPAAADRPPHVRAGSGVCWWGAELAIVQDDCDFLALVDPSAKTVRSIALPAGADGRRQFLASDGSKKRKADLESVLVWPDGSLVGLGSGSTPKRERWLVASRGADGQVQTRWLDASPLYALLRREKAFAGSELNIEGAAVVGGWLWLLQRGNGAAVGALNPVDALARLPLRSLELGQTELAWRHNKPPKLQVVASLDLGAEPVRKTGTDLLLRSVEGKPSLWLTVAAEASPDTYQDGDVVWSGLARLAKGAPSPSWELAPLVDLHGGLTRDKLEGLTADPQDSGRFWAVVDADDPDKPCRLLELRVMGPDFQPQTLPK